MKERENIVAFIATVCEELDVFRGEDALEHLTSDFFDAMAIDSMSITFLRHAIAEQFEIDIPIELFMTELRNLEQVVDYIDGLTQTPPAKRRPVP